MDLAPIYMQWEYNHFARVRVVIADFGRAIPKTRRHSLNAGWKNIQPVPVSITPEKPHDIFWGT